MKILFRQFEFDLTDNSLGVRGGQKIALRPKAALLLRYLLQHREKIVAKAELITVIWGHSDVDDQALFQLIAELRAKLKNPSFIRTYPGRGYQWNCTTEVGRAMPAPKLRWALAGFVGALACVQALELLESYRSPLDPITSDREPLTAFSPAADALAKAVEARSDGYIDHAVELLTIAIGEYPRFALAKLEMAETLRGTGQLIHAQGYAYDALSDARLAEDAYLEVSAQLLLSQLRWQQGDIAGALSLNSAAGKLAEQRHFVCAAELSSALDRLLIQALASPGESHHPPSLSQQSTLARCHKTSSTEQELNLTNQLTS